MDRLKRLLAPTTTVRAHCDLPCGVYDPEQARIEAESCFRIMEKYQASSDETFRADKRTIRYGMAEILYGHDEIAAFRAARSPVGLMRTISKTVISTYGRDFAVASTLFHRDTMPGKVGRQMQTWVRFPDGWHVVAAHVSLVDEDKVWKPQ